MMDNEIKRTLRAAADKLRSNMDAAEYKHIVLGLMKLEVLVPNERVLECYTDFLRTTFTKVNSNLKEVQRVSEIRDALLPRLMPGKIRVGAAEGVLMIL